MRTHIVGTRAIGLVLLGSLTFQGCAAMNRKETGATSGAILGGAAGAAIGRANGSTAKGAILGAAIGGTVGAVIGHQMDQQAKEIKQQIPGAVIERVGEGIQVTFASGLLFDFDSDRILGEAASNLRNLSSSLDKYPGSDLLIVGHTDSKGEDAYNQSLSERRARATADYLVSQGVTRTRLRTSGRGEAEPVADNTSERGMQKNRRVEVAIYASDAYKESLRKSGQ
jgi:outer membrane protein OmpA-like peptidoglycan-associated protein